MYHSIYAETITINEDNRFYNRGFVIAIGDSPHCKDILHAVIWDYKNSELIFDPSSVNSGLRGKPDHYCIIVNHYKKGSYMDKEDKVREDLETKLKIIGWELRHCGCENYRLHNHRGQATGFLYYGGELRDENSGSPRIFGSSHCGTIFIKLERCNVEVFDPNGKPYVSIMAKSDSRKDSAIFISFYNHDK